ncbi:MAG: hypothetical protein WD766_09080 [Gemmatimonadota bacterium]
MLNQTNTRGRAGRKAFLPWRKKGLLTLLPLLAVAGCDIGSLLEVEDPDVILPGAIEGVGTLPAVHAHAIGEFSVAYGGNPATFTEGQILEAGMLTDELIHTGTFDSREIIDRRVVLDSNGSIRDAYHNLQRARAAADFAAEVFADLAPNTESHAEVQNLEGYAEVIFGENYCSGVPFSRQTIAGEIQYGNPLTTVQMFESGVGSFESALAIATAAGSAEQQSLARVGLGRALLDLGRFSEAAAAVAAVPTNFEYVTFHSAGSSRQNNAVWVSVTNGGTFSVASQEGNNGLPFRTRGDIDGSISDPRIPAVHIGTAERGTLRPHEHWGQLKYPLRESPTVLASGVEARLIEAEAALNQGASGVPQFVSIHNDIRDDVGLAPLNLVDVAAMSQPERVDLHFEERAYWLYLTSHRLGDLRRLLWDYGRAQADVFPVGPYFRGTPPDGVATGNDYGTHTNYPVHIDERNNPNFEDCLTRNDEAGRHG